MPIASLRPAAIVALALAFTVSVAWTLIVPGPFEWHVTQPDAWQGFVEFIVLVALLHAALSLPASMPRRRALLLFLPLALYLRRHHVDLALLTALAYVEGMIALGACARRATGSAAHADAWLRDLMCGIALLSLLLWIGQAVDYGEARDQRRLALALLLPALLLQWRRLHSMSLLRTALQPRASGERFWIACMLGFVAMLFARSNGVWDSDSMWYGFRSDRVLVGERSVFEALGYASPVYYFPKLYEVLMLPLAASRDHSFVQGGTILLGVCLACLVHRMLRRLQVASPLRLALVFVAATIPAFANTASGAKPDVFVALLLVAMLWFGWNIAEGRRGDLRWVFACAGLAVSSKLIAIAYVGVAGIVCLLAAWRAPRADGQGREPVAWLALAAATAVGVFVCARTWWLSGLPTIGPEQLVSLWRAMGMSLIAPIGELSWVRPQTWSELPLIAAGWLAYPSLLPLIIVTWPGNVWVFLPLAALLCGRAQTRDPSPRLLLWALPMAGLALLIGIGFANRGGDGNYFIAPVLLATVAGGAMLARRAIDARNARAVLVALGLFALLHVAYGFVSASWALGTRRWDWNFTAGNRDMALQLAQRYRHFGLDGVVAHLRDVHGSRLRLVGHTDLGMGYRLPARYEELTDIALTHPHRTRREQMQTLLACGGVRALLLPHDGRRPTAYPGAVALIAWADAQPASKDLYRDKRWRLIALDALPACPDPRAAVNR